MSVKGAAVLFIEPALFIPNSKISSEKLACGPQPRSLSITVHA